MGWKALSVDLNLCTGCRSCEARCAFKHHHECNPSNSRVVVVKFDHLGLSVPVFCLNCKEAFCKNVCPTKAIQRDEKTGALYHKEEKCIGCLACTMVCPFSGLQVLSKRKVVKCDLCEGDPYCVKYCETGAIRYVELEDMRVHSAYTLAQKFMLPFETKK
jgi:carbon-monoxide dehydrogenase iron sulfur subunit